MKTVSSYVACFLSVLLSLSSPVSLAAGEHSASSREKRWEEEVRRVLLDASGEQVLFEVRRNLMNREPVSARVLTLVLGNKNFMGSLVPLYRELLSNSRLVQVKNEEEIEGLLSVVTDKLRESKNTQGVVDDLDFLYADIMAGWGEHPRMWRQVQDWAFSRAEAAARGIRPSEQLWGAYVLGKIARGDFFGRTEYREIFERKLEAAIYAFNGLKNEKADFLMAGVEGRITTNQSAMLGLLMQVTSLGSSRRKKDIPLVKNLLNTSNLASEERFVDKGDLFWFHHAVPGTDGEGNFTLTPGGRKHLVLYFLTDALFASYASRRDSEGIGLMSGFVSEYFSTGADGKFARYLYIPFLGMYLARQYHGGAFMWESDWLEKQVSDVLVKNYTGAYITSNVQKTAEVTAKVLLYRLIADLFSSKKGSRHNGGPGTDPAPEMRGRSLDPARLQEPARAQKQFAEHQGARLRKAR